MSQAPHHNPSRIIVIVPAAGKGLRMGLETPKQFLPLNGKAILIHTIEGLLQENVHSVVVAVHPDYVEHTHSLLSMAEVDVTRVKIVVGKNERQDTVAHALSLCEIRNDDLVLVHDAVRPFFSRKLVQRVITSASEFGACVPVLPVTDTIKEVSDTTITATVSRDVLRRAQTPQGFSARVLLQAYDNARRLGLRITDDSSAVEALQHIVATVEGEEQNIKITTAADLLWAEYFCKLR